MTIDVTIWLATIGLGRLHDLALALCRLRDLALTGPAHLGLAHKPRPRGTAMNSTSQVAMSKLVSCLTLLTK
jgi:hypothetical protein